MIERHHPTLSIGAQCRLLSISRSSFYYAPQGETASMIQQIDAAAALNGQLKKNAERAATFQEAMASAAEGVEGDLKSALSDLFATGEMDLAKLGDSIRRTFADAAANWVVDQMGIGNMLGGGKSASGAQAGQTIATSMVSAGNTVAAQIAAAMRTGGQSVRLGHIQGGQTAANAQRMAGVAHDQQVRLATTTAGRQHGVTVKTAIDAGAQGHAAAVGAAMGGEHPARGPVPVSAA